MKIKEGYMLRQIAGTWIVVPIAERVVDFNGMISLSDTGAFLWQLMEKEQTTESDLLSALLDEYEVDQSTAQEDLSSFLNQLKENVIFVE